MPQEKWTVFCECCGHQRDGWREVDFYAGDEVDPEEMYEVIDLTALTFKVDYEIIQYP